MRAFILTAALLGGTALAAPAHAWQADSTVTGPQGQSVTRSGSGGCADGSCSRSGSLTGPQGQTATRSRTVARTTPGAWSAQRSATGPRGATVTRSGSVTGLRPRRSW